MKPVLVFTALMLFICSGQTADGGKGAKYGFSSDSGHGSPGAGGGGFSSTGLSTFRDPRKAPPLEERRKVSEQDCTKPVDLSSGNLRCK